MDDKIREKCAEMMMHFHSSTETWAGEFFQNLGRKYYVTPTSYLEMIQTFKSLLAER
jgi:dynein heavy chain